MIYLVSGLSQSSLHPVAWSSFCSTKWQKLIPNSSNPPFTAHFLGIKNFVRRELKIGMALPLYALASPARRRYIARNFLTAFLCPESTLNWTTGQRDKALEFLSFPVPDRQIQLNSF